ncbi:CocE/NonD family hydrolase [Paenibacillus sp. CGMCC 1.16610]|uniref:CocE/NonD family hydrolase n=1 Tax=Paenibacillus anseongense TaxID=2682845 RepID=A0ABW9UI32_9BACL|nr:MULTISPECIES: CocE/NonD family hydrolase [Paenibacillus]MBA2942883.1 CocE/NonD family hydrolase [Paenibacillus sp. CGMCC 1.16610]MVQ38368.1 CocE/NonD family hydrolase [Paenibacillus anseongense]
MSTYFQSTTFNLYCAGVYEGKIRFAEKAIMHAKVDARRRTQMQENVLPERTPYILPFSKIRSSLAHYEQAVWQGDEVTLGNGDLYVRHVSYTAVAGVAGRAGRAGQLAGTEQSGQEKTSQVWAMRKDTALDIVTVDGRIIAFVAPNRYGMEVLVAEGHEALTPLVVYEDPLLSKPEFGVNDLGTFLVPMRDGVRLATDVYLPEGTRSPQGLPTILIRTCYDRNLRKEFFKRWANKGYAVVNQDVRGRADSEGELVPFFYERDDSADTIDWIVSQEWSNGSVGMWGASYLGYVVTAASTSGHPNLKAVVNEVNVGSPFVDTVRKGGTVCSWPLLCWTLAQSVGTRTDFDIFAGKTVDPEKAVDARPIREVPQQMIGRASGPWDLWSEHPEYDDFWRNCTFTERGDQVKVPMFVISGWYDGDSAGVSETWRMLTKHDVPNRKIWLGPWEHGPNRARDLLGTSFSNDAVVYDYDVNVLRWFDRFLKELPNGIDQEARAKYYVVGSNEWRTSEDWTPAEAQIKNFYLGSKGRANSSHGDGVLMEAPSQQSPADTFVYNPEDPVADSGEREPENMRKHELRSDILVYSSAVLERDLTVAGELSCELYAASTGVDTDWVVTLSDVDAQGNSIKLSNYIVRAKYRGGLDNPELLTPGKIEKYAIFMQNIAHTFREGHKLRFTVTSSSKFIAFPNTNTGINPYEDPKPVIVQQTIYHSEEYPSHVKLPIIL